MRSGRGVLRRPGLLSRPAGSPSLPCSGMELNCAKGFGSRLAALPNMRLDGEGLLRDRNLRSSGWLGSANAGGACMGCPSCPPGCTPR